MVVLFSATLVQIRQFPSVKLPDEKVICSGEHVNELLITDVKCAKLSQEFSSVNRVAPTPVQINRNAMF